MCSMQKGQTNLGQDTRFFSYGNSKFCFKEEIVLKYKTNILLLRNQEKDSVNNMSFSVRF